jgi:hypothetical protein
MQNRPRELEAKAVVLFQVRKKRSLHLKINPLPTEQQQYKSKPWASARVPNKGLPPLLLLPRRAQLSRRPFALLPIPPHPGRGERACALAACPGAELIGWL